MISKKTVLHITESLGRGGAEVLFVNYINALPANYRNIVVYLRPVHTLKPELQNTEAVICTNYHNKYDVVSSALKLRRILKKYQVDLVHTHLYWPTLVARLAVPAETPLIFSVHNIISEDAFKLNLLSKYVEMLTYSEKQYALFVSQAAYKDYISHIKVGGYSKVLYNFIRPVFFNVENHKITFSGQNLRLVSVGNLRVQKNNLFLIKALAKLKHLPITLDIYGEGPQRDELEYFIEEEQITNVRLMGSISHPEYVLKDYDVFVSATCYEGFYIAMVEAMAVGLPCILPDLEVLREVSGHKQMYYENNNEDAFINYIVKLFENRHLLRSLEANSTKGASKYTLQAHLDQLTQVYSFILNSDGR